MTNVIQFPARHCPYALRVKRMMDEHKVTMPLVQIGWIIDKAGEPTRKPVHRLCQDQVADGYTLIMSDTSLFVSDCNGKSLYISISNDGDYSSNAAHNKVAETIEEVIGWLENLNWNRIAHDVVNSNRVKKARDKR